MTDSNRRKAATDRVLGLASLLALALIPLAPASLVISVAGVLMGGASFAIGVRRSDWPVIRLTLVVLLIAAAGIVGLPFAHWFVVVVIWVASRSVGRLAPNLGWVPPGRASAATWVLGGVTVVGAGVALSLWIHWTDRLGDATIDLIDAAQKVPIAVVVGVALVFVVVNSVAEEIIYRHIAYEVAMASLRPHMAVVAQAVAFGTFHLVGFPAGTVGVGLAFAYGIALGEIRLNTDGLLFPIAVHAAADATIAFLVVDNYVLN